MISAEKSELSENIDSIDDTEPENTEQALKKCYNSTDLISVREVSTGTQITVDKLFSSLNLQTAKKF